MLESFGARLRQRREEQAIALATIAQETKIKQSLLEALERDDVSHWPGGIFRRAFIRAYAQAIGLDPDVVVQQFLAVHPDPAAVIETAPAIDPRGDGAWTKARPPTRLHDIVGSAIASLSRLRRSPAAADREPVSDAPVHAPVPAEPSLPVPAHPPPEPRASSDPDFLAVAHLCAEFGRIERIGDAQPLLQEAARLLEAVGLIVWAWDEGAAQLRPALVHGYSDKVLAQLPAVTRDSDNATAAAFRSAQTCAIKGSDRTSGALVVPLLTPAGCAGVFAIELQHGREQTRSVRAAAMILASVLAPFVSGQARKDREVRRA